jgi:hypothetical protein
VRLRPSEVRRLSRSNFFSFFSFALSSLRSLSFPRTRSTTSSAQRTLLPLLTREPAELPLERTDSGRRLEFVLSLF